MLKEGSKERSPTSWTAQELWGGFLRCPSLEQGRDAVRHIPLEALEAEWDPLPAAKDTSSLL